MKKILLIFSLFFLFSNLAYAETQMDYAGFAQLPIMHEGRIKPMDSFARIKLKEIYGHEKIDGKSAAQWLAQSLFDPGEAVENRVFEILDPELKTQLELDQKQTRFSVPELKPGLGKILPQIETLQKTSPENLTPQQSKLLNLYKSIVSYNELLRSFSMIMPLSLNPPGQYQNLPPFYLDYMPSEKALMEKVKKIVKKKGSNPEKYSQEEQTTTNFAYALEKIRNGGSQSNIFRVLSTGKTEWVSPWALVLEEKQRPQNPYFSAWENLSQSHNNGDESRWQKSVENALELYQPSALIKLEIIYNTIKPFHCALILYLVGLITLLLTAFKNINLNYSLAFISAAIFTHTAGIMSRILILQRPPVGTLYESILFVSLICAAIGLISAFKKRDITIIFCGAFAATLLLLIAPSMLQQGENMEMLVAVLNTNFWLATHVLCITAGYGVSILTSCLAHAWLAANLWNKSIDKINAMRGVIYKTSLVALLLTSIGTILGGIWADQSWGRFWGWDPKENGALLIVLWLIWIQHGRIAKRMDTAFFMAAAAFLNVIVALAWFGVNLLSVGLHSYGFTSGIALALGLFCTIETILIGMLWLLNSKRKTINAAI